jgi:hypothetical protein
MAFTKKMFGTGAKKFFFGAGVGTVGSLVLNLIAPQWANHPIAKAGEAALSYSVGGVEAAVGTATTLLLPMATRGTRALDNTQTESL